MEIKHYMIRDTNTGLFSTGGTTPNWTRGGKVWTNIGHLKNHLRQHANYMSDPEYAHLYEKNKWRGTTWNQDDYWAYVNYQNELYDRFQDFLPENWEIVVVYYVYASENIYPVSQLDKVD